MEALRGIGDVEPDAGDVGAEPEAMGEDGVEAIADKDGGLNARRLGTLGAWDSGTTVSMEPEPAGDVALGPSMRLDISKGESEDSLE